MTDSLDTDAIAHALNAGCRSLRLDSDSPRIGDRLEIHETIGSTNDRADELGQSGAGEGWAVFAEMQTAGRGRGGNRWSAPPGRNLTFSVLLRPAWPVGQWPRMAHVAGLAVARAAEIWSADVPVRLKWPNDIYADGRKLAGMLLELKGGRHDSYLVLGIGINVNSLPQDFPPELQSTVTTMRYLNHGNPIDRNHLAGAILAELTALCRAASTDFPGVLDQVRERSLLLGRKIQYQQHGAWKRAELTGFGENGEMEVRIGDRTELVAAAELVRLADGPE
jgi:BirA family biotin operon repressor/biotin-[acetyl-CoA-carboxylase] ligase